MATRPAVAKKLHEWLISHRLDDGGEKTIVISDTIKGNQSQIHEVAYGEAYAVYPQIVLALSCSEKEAILVTRIGEICQGKCTVFVNNISEQEAPYTLSVTILPRPSLAASTPC